MRKRLMMSVMVGALVAAMLPGVASAAKPEFFTDVITETFHDDFLTEECGVDVETTIQGKYKGRLFEEDGKGPIEVNTLNLSIVARAGDNSFKFRDVGSDSVHQGPDGSLTLLITGQVPFGFKGALKIDLLTDEVILEPSREVDTTRACRALTK